MRNQFFYTDKVKLPVTEEGAEPEFQEKRNSFNMDKVIRTLTMDNGQLLVLLDDMHERVQEIPTMKNGRKTIIKEKQVFQSEIFLTKEDSDRFFELTNIKK